MKPQPANARPNASRSSVFLNHLGANSFKIILLGSFLVFIGFQALFPSLMVSHEVADDRHIFANSFFNITFHVSYCALIFGWACYRWWKLKDRFGASLLLLFFGFNLFVMPQTLHERVEVTATRLTYRRNPSDIYFNVNVAFDDIQSAVELLRSNGSRGFRLRLKNGRNVELPNDSVPNAAWDVIRAQLRKLGIPTTVEITQPNRN